MLPHNLTGFKIKSNTGFNIFTIPYWQYWCADIIQRVLLLAVERVEVLTKVLIEQTAAFLSQMTAVRLHTY